MFLLAPSCSDPSDSSVQDKKEPLRRGAFKSVAARDLVLSCPSAGEREETEAQMRRFDELKQLAVRKRAGHAIWLGENDWAAISRHADPPSCGAGDQAYREALSAFSFALDTLAQRIAQYRE